MNRAGTSKSQHLFQLSERGHDCSVYLEDVGEVSPLIMTIFVCVITGDSPASH